MVHALQEAHRVLKPGGIMIDLRPAAEHRRLGLGEGRRWRVVGRLHESLDEDQTANAAVARVVRDGYFREELRTQFLLDRVMDTSGELREWLADFIQRRELTLHAPLLKQLKQRMSRLHKPGKIAVRGHMTLGILKKLDPGDR
jgi:SAM-dependent methyltransferase